MNIKDRIIELLEEQYPDFIHTKDVAEKILLIIADDRLTKEYDAEAISQDLQFIAEKYSALIHPLRAKNGIVYINTQARQKIKSRMKEFTVAELVEVVDNFSKDEWQMKHNSRRGLAWLYHSEDRVQRFLDTKPLVEVKNDGETTWLIDGKSYTLMELKNAEMRGEVYYKNDKWYGTKK